MKIAIVSDFFLDFVGGAQSSIEEQRTALEAAGHTVFLVANARSDGGLRPNDLPVQPWFTVPGLELPVVRTRRPLIEQLKTFFVDNAVDVIHLQSEFGLAHAATIAARELSLGVVQTIHTFYWESEGILPTIVAPVMRAALQSVIGGRIPHAKYVKRPSDNLLRNLTVEMAEQADVAVSPSAHQADDLRTAGIRAPIHVIPNPIARSGRPAQLLSAEQAQHPRFLWVARCESVKRPLVFAEAVLEALARTNDGFEVDFVGDGSELGKLRNLLGGHPNVRVHGALSHERVLDLMDAASATALTSYDFDNQPMTIAESVNRYRGVLYCDPKLVEGLAHSGFLARTPDALGLADALVELVATPAKLIELSQGARTDAAIFSSKTYVEKITTSYALARRG